MNQRRCGFGGKPGSVIWPNTGMGSVTVSVKSLPMADALIVMVRPMVSIEETKVRGGITPPVSESVGVEATMRPLGRVPGKVIRLDPMVKLAGKEPVCVTPESR